MGRTTIIKVVLCEGSFQNSLDIRIYSDSRANKQQKHVADPAKAHIPQHQVLARNGFGEPPPPPSQNVPEHALPRRIKKSRPPTGNRLKPRAGSAYFAFPFASLGASILNSPSGPIVGRSMTMPKSPLPFPFRSMPRMLTNSLTRLLLT